MGLDPYFLNPKRERCVRCGEVARGSAQINGERYCHGDDPYPTCYMFEQWEDAGLLAEASARMKRDSGERISLDEVLHRLASQ